MIPSRLSRSQERKLTKKLTLAIAGSIGLIIFIVLFGVKILINFSLFVDAIRGGGSSQNQISPLVILPPIINPLPEATNTAVLTVSGRGTAGLGLILYLNDKEYRKLKIDETGTFSVRDITFKEGSNTLWAQLFDAQNNKSDVSATASVIIIKKQPALEISSPKDGDTLTGDSNILIVSGKTEESNSVTVNGRIAVVGVSGIFNLRYPLNEGDNTITIVATDQAGNEKKDERKVRYQK